VAIEEVFLVYHDGVLISHLSRSLVQEKDEDVLSGMLTAVQEFVREAFRYGEHRELHQMDFGDYRILIERGRLAYLAVVYSGRDGGAVRKKIRGVLDRIEATYSGVLEKWDGDMEKVVGVRDLIREYLLKSGRTSKGLVPT
jgi:OOP family OmpA-OmpF porin